MFTTLFTPRGEHSLLFRRMERQTDDHPYMGEKVHPWGITSPLGSSSPLRKKLITGLGFRGFKCYLCGDQKLLGLTPPYFLEKFCRLTSKRFQRNIK
jgi:hypothetical protein